MVDVLLVGRERNEQLLRFLADRGINAAFSSTEDVFEHPLPDILILDLAGFNSPTDLRGFLEPFKDIPIILLVPLEKLESLESLLNITDFVLKPCHPEEVFIRIKKASRVKNNNMDEANLIKCGDLVIDPSRCEVTVKGEVVSLTFKEYQLLKFLASNKGKVFSRQALLDKIWSYDYFGGERTVDVHIRRLRSKIGPSFIETVRGMGYRFKDS